MTTPASPTTAAVGMGPRIPDTPLAFMVGNVVVTAIYWAISHVNWLLFHQAGILPMPIWPAAAVAVATGLIWGWRGAPGVAAGTVLANAVSLGAPWSVSAGIAVMNTVGPLLAASLIRRKATTLPPFGSVADISHFLLYGVVLMPVLTATGAMLSRRAFGGLAWEAIPEAWGRWCVGHAAGSLLFCPVLLGWWANRRPLPLRDGLRFAGIGSVTLAVTAVWFFSRAGGVLSMRGLGYLLIIPMAWVAVHYHYRETATLFAAVILVAMTGTVFGHGVFADSAYPLLPFAFMAVSYGLTLLFLGAVTQERQAAVGDLRRSEEKSSRVFQLSPDLISLSAMDNGLLLDVNQGFEENTGWTRAEVLGRRTTDLGLWVDPADRLRLVAMLKTQGSITNVEMQYRTKAGQVRQGLFSARLMKLQGEPWLLVMARDITERRQAEETLRFTQFALDRMADAAYWMKADGRFIYANSAASLTLGYSPEELRSMAISDIDPDCPREVWPARWADLRQRGTLVFETRHRTKAGTLVPVEVRASLLEFAGTEYNCVLVRDLTERKQAEAAYRSLVLHSLQGLVIIQDLRLAFVNPAAAELTGYPAEELRAFSPAQVAELVHPEDREAALRIARARLAGEPTPARQEFRLARKDGTVRWVESLASLIEYQGRPATQVAYLDITERRQADAERRHLEQQMQQTQKLESLGVLAGGIAHDFNNLLMAILGNADLALGELPSMSPARESLREIEKASRRAADLCRQMLAYSGKGRYVIEPIGLRELVEEMVHLLRASISKKALLNLNLAADPPSLLGDATQIRQILMNLVINASEALGDQSGVITISTGVMACPAEYLRGAYVDEGLPAGRYVWLEVSDTGCGMDAETRKRIFEPFYTTKFTGRGLGLSAVLGIVRGHRGALKLDSEPGKGTTFKVLFPAAAAPAPVSPPSAAPEAAWHGQGTVLLVDDEEAVRTTARRILERLGFSVLLAEDGRQALEVFRVQRDQITLVLLDLTMPRLNGEETYRELRQIDPALKVIMCSGYSEIDVASRFAGKGLAGYAEKPYTKAQLETILRRVLGDATPASPQG